MKVLVYPHDLAIGGSQINAIDLGATMRDLGHDVIVYGQNGPLADYISSKRLPLVRASEWQMRPAPSRIAQLVRLCRRAGVDVIHAYEWPPCLDAYYGARALGIPVVCTVLSMSVSPLVPASVPLYMGTEELAAEARRARRPGDADVGVFEPPIDVVADHPVDDSTAARAAYGLRPEEMSIVSVSRLSIDLKLDALKDAIDAAGLLAAKWPIRLILVGGGDAEQQLRDRASAINAAAGREVVSLPGPTLDPRRAYAAADVVVGMGSSALRAMAHAKPVVVQGERGWSLECTPETVGTFLRQGFYGVGSGGSGAMRLSEQLTPLLESADRRHRVGTWGRELVVRRFSLESGARRLLDHYAEARARQRLGREVAAWCSTTGRALVHETRLHLPAHQRRRSHERRAALERAGQAVTTDGPPTSA